MPEDERPDDPDREGQVSTVLKPKVEKPRRFKVILHNDDYTTMEFVVLVLMQFFHKTETEATHVMLSVHHKGYGVAGVYPRDLAETKVSQVSDFARKQGHPLRLTCEPE
jgi:ATP-dependent Clp protease adaptor protein ClpS